MNWPLISYDGSTTELKYIYTQHTKIVIHIATFSELFNFLKLFQI